jgi:hypothetical protein
MRISKWDVPVDVYTVAEAPNSEGYMVKTLTKTGTAVKMDLQPIGSKITLASYGLEKVAADSKRAFCDAGALALGQIVSTGIRTYIVKGLSEWYSHSEAIIEPFQVTLP